MEKESVLFKGLKTGLLLVLVGKPEFSAVEREIREKLETSALFFRRGTVIEWRTGTFTAKESLALKKLFLQHGLYFREMKEEADAQKPVVSAVSGAARAGVVLGRKKAESSEMKTEPDADKKDVQMLVVNRTLRGGQEVQSQGSVLILGNVNPRCASHRGRQHRHTRHLPRHRPCGRLRRQGRHHHRGSPDARADPHRRRHSAVARAV